MTENSLLFKFGSFVTWLVTKFAIAFCGLVDALNKFLHKRSGKTAMGCLLLPTLALILILEIVESIISFASMLLHCLQTGHFKFRYVEIREPYEFTTTTYHECSVCRKKFSVRLSP